MSADEPTAAEIANLTTRLRALSDARRSARPEDVARFQRDRDDLLRRAVESGAADPISDEAAR